MCRDNAGSVQRASGRSIRTQLTKFMQCRALEIAGMAWIQQLVPLLTLIFDVIFYAGCALALYKYVAAAVAERSFSPSAFGWWRLWRFFSSSPIMHCANMTFRKHRAGTRDFVDACAHRGVRIVRTDHRSDAVWPRAAELSQLAKLHLKPTRHGKPSLPEGMVRHRSI
jgi:hypothetical protein